MLQLTKRAMLQAYHELPRLLFYSVFSFFPDTDADTFVLQYRYFSEEWEQYRVRL